MRTPFSRRKMLFHLLHKICKRIYKKKIRVSCNNGYKRRALLKKGDDRRKEVISSKKRCQSKSNRLSKAQFINPRRTNNLACSNAPNKLFVHRKSTKYYYLAVIKLSQSQFTSILQTRKFNHVWYYFSPRLTFLI